VTFHVQFTRTAQEDLERLFEFIIEGSWQAQLATSTSLTTRLRQFVPVSRLFRPIQFAWRKASNSPFLRELVIPFGSSGHVVEAIVFLGTNLSTNKLLLG